MITGLDKSEVFEFVPSVEKDANNPTKFLLGVLTCMDRVVLISKIEKADDPSIYIEIVKKGLKGIKNYQVKGEVKDVNEITDDVLDTLPTQVVKEIFVKLLEINFLSEQEVKN